MHTNSIIELNNTAYQKTSLFSEPLWEKSTNFMLKGNAYGHGGQKFQWPMLTGLPILRFDVEEAKSLKQN
jgi:alanine racemase